jgi:hypothetical protein
MNLDDATAEDVENCGAKIKKGLVGPTSKDNHYNSIRYRNRVHFVKFDYFRALFPPTCGTAHRNVSAIVGLLDIRCPQRFDAPCKSGPSKAGLNPMRRQRRGRSRERYCPRQMWVRLNCPHLPPIKSSGRNHGWGNLYGQHVSNGAWCHPCAT